MAFIDSAMALGLIEAVEPDDGVYSFVHALTRQAVLEGMPGSRRVLLHARAAEALESQEPAHALLVPRLAQHFLAAHILGFHEQALRYSKQDHAAKLAERSLAFEEAALWFERAASLPECDPAVRAEMLLAAASDYVQACHFPSHHVIYERLDAIAEPSTQLAAIGFEDATWRPGVDGAQLAPPTFCHRPLRVRPRTSRPRLRGSPEQLRVGHWRWRERRGSGSPGEQPSHRPRPPTRR